MADIPDETDPLRDPAGPGNLPAEFVTPVGPMIEEPMDSPPRGHAENIPANRPPKLRPDGRIAPPVDPAPEPEKSPTMGDLAQGVEKARDALVEAEEDIQASQLRLMGATTRFNEATKHLDEAMRNLKQTAPSLTDWANRNKGG